MTNYLVQQLPKEIGWSFLQYKDSLGYGWKKFYGGSAASYYYYKDYPKGSKEWKKVHVCHIIIIIRIILKEVKNGKKFMSYKLLSLENKE
jgi:hypothetical protein